MQVSFRCFLPNMNFFSSLQIGRFKKLHLNIHKDYRRDSIQPLSILLICYFQRPEKRRELRLKKFWRSPKTTSSEESAAGDSPTRIKPPRINQLQLSPVFNRPTCSLPLLQVWPSQVYKPKEKIFRIVCEINMQKLCMGNPLPYVNA